MLRDALQVSLRVGEPPLLELPDALAPAARIAHEPSFESTAQVLGDALPRQIGTRAELGDRGRAVGGEPLQEPDARRSPSAAKSGAASRTLAAPAP
jgi:hypothetical protein